MVSFHSSFARMVRVGSEPVNPAYWQLIKSFNKLVVKKLETKAAFQLSKQTGVVYTRTGIRNDFCCNILKIY